MLKIQIDIHSRVDFHIVNITSVICIVECDEDQHQGYPISCELTRMEQIHEALMKSGFQKKVVFVRYSPNGAVYHNGQRLQRLKKDREAALLQLLQLIQDEDGKEDDKNSNEMFPQPINIIYLFYNMENNIPTICLDPEYSPQMYSCVCLPLCLL